MKHTYLLCLVILLGVFAQSQILQPSSLREKISSPIFRQTLAQCYEGSVNIMIEQGTSSKLTYFACFATAKTPCTYKSCYDGWISNYTSEQTGFVEGYPKNTQDQAPVFKLSINSAADLNIQKSEKLSQSLDRLIDIACSSFDPTVASPRVRATQPVFSPAFSPSLSAFQGAPLGTREINLIDGARLDLSTQQQKLYIPEFSFAKTTTDGAILNAKTAAKQLEFSGLDIDIKVNDASVMRQLKYDRNAGLVLDRTDTVKIFLSNTGGQNIDQINNESPFDGKVMLNLIKRGTQSYSAPMLAQKLNNIKTIYTLQDLEKRRTIKVIDLQAEVDNLDNGIPQESKSQRAFDLDKELLQPSFAITDRISSIGRIGARLLQEIVIFSNQKVLYERTVLGKTIKVSILVVAKLTNNKQTLVLTGTLKFNFFGKTKNIVVFQQSRNINFNWSYSNTISGTWSFNFYIPLPPPVSFIGINFSFSATFSVSISLGLNGSTSASVYTFNAFANVGSSLTADASAALRVIAIEGGVFISGTLISVRTDPRLTLRYKYAAKQLQVLLDWKFHLRAFAFKWGFFWRYWRLFKGWSPRKIIKQWTITNGIQRTYPILSLDKTYNL